MLLKEEFIYQRLNVDDKCFKKPYKLTRSQLLYGLKIFGVLNVRKCKSNFYILFINKN